MTGRPMMQSDIRRMHELAERGLHHAEIARSIGRNRHTVRRHLGTKGVRKRIGLSINDLREWYAARRAVDREEMAERFGFTSAAAMGVAVCRARKRLADQGIHLETSRDRLNATTRTRLLRFKSEYEARPRGEKFMGQLAARHGFASEASGWCALSRAKKMLAAEARA